MNFKLPSKLNSKRASSFHSKKLVLPGLHSKEDAESLLFRKNANTATNKRTLSDIERKDSPNTPTQNNLHRANYKISELNEHESHSFSIINSKTNYIHDLIDKVALQRPAISKINDEYKRKEEKYLQIIDSLNEEIKRLTIQIKKIKGQKNKEKKKDNSIIEKKLYKDNFTLAVEQFIRKIKINTEKLCSLINSSLKNGINLEINFILKSMNEDINKLSPFISQEVIVANQFLSYEQESAENTGRFKSLNDTLNLKLTTQENYVLMLETGFN